MSAKLAAANKSTTRPTKAASIWSAIRKNYAFGRICQSLFTIYLVASFSFVLMRWMPGDPLNNYVNRLVREQGFTTVEAQRMASNLVNYDPGTNIIQQYIDYMKNLVQGDLGESIVSSGTPVTAYVFQYLGWTLFSVGLGLIIAFILGLALGVLSAYNRNSWFDHLISNVSSILNAIPNYVWAMMIVVVFGVNLHWFSVTDMRGTHSPGTQVGWNLEFLWDAMYHASLPILTYVLTSVGGWTLQMKSSTTQVLDEDFITVAKARGLHERTIHVSYVGRNAVLPLFSLFAVQLGFMVGGSTLVEQIFQYDGMGMHFFASINNRDYPVMQGFILIITISVIVANLVADLLLSRIDPRIHTS